MCLKRKGGCCWFLWSGWQHELVITGIHLRRSISIRCCKRLKESSWRIKIHQAFWSILSAGTVHSYPNYPLKQAASIWSFLLKQFLRHLNLSQLDPRTDLTVWSIYGHGSVPYTDGWRFAATRPIHRFGFQLVESLVRMCKNRFASRSTKIKMTTYFH